MDKISTQSYQGRYFVKIRMDMQPKDPIQLNWVIKLIELENQICSWMVMGPGSCILSL